GLDAWIPEDPRDSRRVDAGIEIAQECRTAVEEEAHGRETSNRHAAGTILIHVAESRCTGAGADRQLQRGATPCRPSDDPLTSPTSTLARCRTGSRAVPSPTAPHVPTCSSSFASHGPS